MLLSRRIFKLDRLPHFPFRTISNLSGCLHVAAHGIAPEQALALRPWPN
jgi:hypothetical protein